MLVTEDQDRLIEFLTRIFNSAQKDHCSGAANEEPRRLPLPQAAAFLLSTGHLVGGVTLNPISRDNESAQDPLNEAVSASLALPFLRKDFEIVAIALTMPIDQKGHVQDVDIGLHHQTIVDMVNRISSTLLLLDPRTGKFKYSEALQEYDYALKAEPIF